MDAAGIVCEFDPFHNGHAYLLRRVKEQGARAVVCVMSGDFVQRGGPAVCDKFLRAKAAVSCGADLVLELPAVYAVNSADRFAAGAVRLLKGLGCLDSIAFGSESADTDNLLKIAEATAYESAEFSESIRSGLSEGLSYPQAYQKALADVHTGLDASVLGSPNDILAVSYLRENIRQNASLKAVAVGRAGAGHKDKESAGVFASATFIRDCIARGNSDWKTCVPKAAEQCQRLEHLSVSQMAERKERLFAIVRQAVLSSSAEELSRVAEVSEGLENRLISAVRSADSYDDLIGRITSSRYTASRAARILTQVILGITKDLAAYAEDNGSAYAKVLAFNSVGAGLLRSVKDSGTVAVYSNINKLQDKNALKDPVLALDLRAADIYNVLCGRPVSDHSDMVQVPEIIQI